MRRFHRPVRRASDILEEFSGSGDPAELSRAAHDTAAILVLLAKERSPEVRARMAEHLNHEGVEEFVQLWKQAAPISLPGALWKLYQIERQLPEGPVASDIRLLLGGHFDGEFGELCERAAIIGRRLGPRWDNWAAELEACANQWYSGVLW